VLTIGEATTWLDTYGKYGWPALVLLVYFLLSRSRVCRELVWVAITDVRYRYLRRRGYSDKELHAWLRRREKAWSESTSSAAAHPARTTSAGGPDQKATG
jgi:hypothetical protein